MRRGHSCSGHFSLALYTSLLNLAYESTPQKCLEFQGNTWQFKDFHAKDPAQVMRIAYCGYPVAPCAVSRPHCIQDFLDCEGLLRAIY